MLPKLQNTQQSPAFGFRRTPQPGQCQKKRQASVGIVSRVFAAQSGQVSTLRRAGATTAPASVKEDSGVGVSTIKAYTLKKNR